jgi:hypothetical protein
MTWSGPFWRAFAQLRYRSDQLRIDRPAKPCQLPTSSGVKKEAVPYQRHKRIMLIHRLFGQHRRSCDLQTLGGLSSTCDT